MNPFLTHPDFIYTRLMAVTWHVNILAPSIFTYAAGDKLRQHIQSDISNKPVILNCSGVSVIEDHAMSAIRSYLLTADRCITFIVEETDEFLIDKITSELNSSEPNKIHIDREQSNNHQLLFCARQQELTHPIKSKLDNLLEKTKKVERKFTVEAVRDCYYDFDKPRRLSSTPLIAKGEFNASKLIADPKTFIWISLLLTDKFLETLAQEKPKTVSLLAVSLRGSPFAAAIRILAENYYPSLEIIDHIGPKHELLEGHIGRTSMCGEQYILVSDFVIGGTEIKVAKTYAIAQGASLKGAITIGSYLPGTDAYDTSIRLRSVVSLREANPYKEEDLVFEFSDREVPK